MRLTVFSSQGRQASAEQGPESLASWTMGILSVYRHTVGRLYLAECPAKGDATNAGHGQVPPLSVFSQVSWSTISMVS